MGEQPDVLYGIKAIGDHLGIDRGQTKHRIAQGLIPTFKIDRAVCSTRSALDAWIKAQFEKGGAQS